MMDYLIKDNQVIFLYKLRAGSSGQSFGINVAKTVKLPSSIIEVARLKTEAMSK